MALGNKGVCITHKERVFLKPGQPNRAEFRAEVVKRSDFRPAFRRLVEEQGEVWDLKVTLALKPEERVSWVERQLKEIKNGKIKTVNFKRKPEETAQISDARVAVYEVVTHSKFPNNLAPPVARQVRRLLERYRDFFSDRQWENISSSCVLAKLFPLTREGAGDRQAGGSTTSSSGKTRTSSSSSSGNKASVDDIGTLPPPPPDAGLGELPPPPPEPEEEDEEAARLRRRREEAAAEVKRKEQALAEARRKEAEAKREADTKKKKELAQKRKANLGGLFALDDNELEEEKPEKFLMQQLSNRVPVPAPTAKPASSFPAERTGTATPSSTGSSLSSDYLQQLNAALNVVGVIHRNTPCCDDPDRKAILPTTDLKDQPKVDWRDFVQNGTRGPREGGRNRSRSRSRRRRDKSRSRSRRAKPSHRLGSGRGSLRSPTPDGRTIGLNRQKHKAKMMAQMLGFQVPR